MNREYNTMPGYELTEMGIEGALHAEIALRKATDLLYRLSRTEEDFQLRRTTLGDQHELEVLQERARALAVSLKALYNMLMNLQDDYKDIMEILVARLLKDYPDLEQIVPRRKGS